MQGVLKVLLGCNFWINFILSKTLMQWKSWICPFRDPYFTVLTEYFFNDYLTRSLGIAQDTIEVLEVLFQKKNFDINRKSSEFRNIFDEELFCYPLDRNFPVLTEILTSDQPVRSVRVTQVICCHQGTGSSIFGDNFYAMKIFNMYHVSIGCTK